MNALKKSLFPLTALLAPWSLTAARPARADVTDNFRSQINYVVFDACHNEDVLVVTNFHGVTKQITNADGSVTTQFHVNAHGTAMGLDSGMLYVFNDSANDVQTTSSSLFTESLFQRTRLLSPGSADNVFLQYELVYHVEGGVATIDVLNQSTESAG